MRMTRNPPTQTGWYWTIHKSYGQIIIHVMIYEGKIHVAENGFHGWSRMYPGQFEIWSESSVEEPEPIDPNL
jgi:hypothetical protein